MNREIAAERKAEAKARPREGNFIKQMRAQRESKEVIASKAFTPFGGKQQVEPRAAIAVDFDVNPAIERDSTRDGEFMTEQGINLAKNNIK
jgi:hypothetical protein